MSVSLTCTPTSPRATVDFAKVLVDDADQNDLTAYTTTAYPTSPELRYYIKVSEGAVEKGRSHVFAVNEDGQHVWDNYVFPDAGSYTLALHNAATDAEVVTLAVTVQ